MRMAFVLVNTVPDQMEWVLEKILTIDGVDDAYMLYGVYDIVAVTKANTIEEIKEIILRIRSVKHTLNTITLMAIG